MLTLTLSEYLAVPADYRSFTIRGASVLGHAWNLVRIVD